jgi:hypothetical protein
MHHTVLAFSRCGRMRLSSLHGTFHLITSPSSTNERAHNTSEYLLSTSSFVVLGMLVAPRNFSFDQRTYCFFPHPSAASVSASRSSSSPIHPLCSAYLPLAASMLISHLSTSSLRQLLAVDPGLSLPIRCTPSASEPVVITISQSYCASHHSTTIASLHLDIALCCTASQIILDLLVRA